MNVLHFRPGHFPELAGTVEETTKEGFFWVNTVRSESGWHKQVQHWLGCSLHDNHVTDCQNEAHPPFYDGTDEYDMLIFRAAIQESSVKSLSTRPVVFIVNDRAVVTISAPDTSHFATLHKKFLSSPKKVPTSTAGLLYLLIDLLVDILLSRRNNVSEMLSNWQERLLDQNDGFEDWQALMKLSSQLRRLEVVVETQLDMISKFQAQTLLTLDQAHAIRFNDLGEHLRRVYNHTVLTQNDIDTLVQTFFSVNTQKTNDILKFLAVISAVFLPLNLMAGVYGMNFAHMPFLHSPFAPWLFAGSMLAVAGGLLLWFQHRHWL